MYAQVEKKPKENSFPTNRQESRAVANSVGQKKSNASQRFGFIDNRPEAITQRVVQLKINNNNFEMIKGVELQRSNNRNNKVAQLVKAYRIGTSASKYKITVSGNAITEFKGGSSGIDISFGDETHAQYYFKTKSNDQEAEMVSWDFPDLFYLMILNRMKKGSKGKNWDQKKMWKAIWNIKAPVNSSDTIVNKGNLIAPHFSLAWIGPLNKYGKGSNAILTTYEDFFDTEKEENTNEFNDSDLVFMYRAEDIPSGFIVEYGEREGFMGNENDWLFASQTDAVEKGWAVVNDFV